MNLKITACESKCARPRVEAIALVITLLMLSVITFLAIAFLSMTRRDRSAVTASLDVDTAHTMSDAALARAQSEIISHMMGMHDILSYDYMASHNFINPLGFTKSATYDSNNVNYSYYYNGPYQNPHTPINWSGTGGGAEYWAQNIANLYYDPRPPVFVVTNANNPSLTDFRYWVDINRNGRFESNGPLYSVDNSGNNLGPANYTGEPEWIGVLKYPEYPHSPTNQFIGRYAYMVLPIGKTLDWNFIHNYTKYNTGAGLNNAMTNYAGDGFIRDQGVGSWELNLAGFLNDLSVDMYSNTGAAPYNYSAISNVANTGYCFQDASQILSFRYNNQAGSLKTLKYFSSPSALFQFQNDGIDEYGIAPKTEAPFDFSSANDPDLNIAGTDPWAGSYDTAGFYDVQDLFDPTKTGAGFQSRLTNVLNNLNTYDSYTFQRLLSCIGTSSSPEYGVYVNDDFGNPALRTKVNINYDNTAQIQGGPYTLMPTNLMPWTPVKFFNSAAELLLRSQVFYFTNGLLPTNLTFGVTNIPIFNATNSAIGYNEQIHRMLQLAVNIYDAAYSTNQSSVQVPVYHPHLFRPEFSLLHPATSNAVLLITNYVEVLPGNNTSNAYTQLLKGFKDLTNCMSPPYILPDDNIWGIPWVVGTVKGNPQLDQVTSLSRILFNRTLMFPRYTNAQNQPDLTKPPSSTNQFYVMWISNTFGIDAWNPYTNAATGSSGSGLTVFAQSYLTIELTNNYNYGFVTNFNLALSPQLSNYTSWPGFAPNGNTNVNQIKTFLVTNFASLPLSYFSETLKQFVPMTNGLSFLNADYGQTTYPFRTWTMSVTNRVNYVLLDGTFNSGAVLDFVNLGPYGMSTNISSMPDSNSQDAGDWVTTASSSPGGPPSGLPGIDTQIGYAEKADGQFLNAMLGLQPAVSGSPFSTSTGGLGIVPPYLIGDFGIELMAADPLVHYTVGDLWDPGLDRSLIATPITYSTAAPGLTGPIGGTVPSTEKFGKENLRYLLDVGAGGNATRAAISPAEMILMDPGISKADDWAFPTNKFPSVGWLGRVHRGTPWQTVYLKADVPQTTSSGYAQWAGWVNNPFSYPTNDWSLVDLFTAVPNDNAARGLLSVNQTNDAAWAAVFSGVVALTSPTAGTPIEPNNGFYSSADFMDATNIALATNIGINGFRSTNFYPNGIFHKVGDILAAPVLTTQSPYVTNYLATNQGGFPLTDEMVERIPQQTLGLLKVGQPQFVIYAWGQSLRPKNLYSGGVGANPLLNNICTNYEITGEFLSRMVCHVVGDPYAASPKIVVDSYNIEPSN